MPETVKVRENKNITLFVVVAMSFMATLDSSIVNVALPVMANKMNVALSSIEWVVAVYSIVICATLLFFGRLGDIVGKSRVFQCGTVVFTAASLLCGLCRSFLPLVICRLIQGVGASAYMANNQGMITELYPHEGRGKALGILAAAVALGTMIGPAAGGFILSGLSWEYIFWVNVPIGVIVFALGVRYLPQSRHGEGKMDIVGAILQFAGTLLLFGCLIGAQKTGFGNPYILTVILLAVILLVLFVGYEKRQNQPMLELQMFHSGQFSLGLMCALISYVCISASTILIPFYLENTLRLSSAQAGLLLMLSPLIIAALSPVCGALSDRVGSEVITMAGLLLMGLGFYLMARLQEHSLIAVFAVFVSIMAVGQSLFQPANNSLIMSACPKNKLGISGSINSLVRNLGQTVGIVLSTTLLYDFMSWKISYRVTDYVKGRDDIFVFGMHSVYLILVAICCVGAIITAFRVIRVKNAANACKNIPQNNQHG